MVVTRSKKSISNCGKGKAITKDNVETHLKKGFDQFKVTLGKPASGSRINEELTFNSKALTTSTKLDAKKKRHIIESSDKPTQPLSSQAGPSKSILKIYVVKANLVEKPASVAPPHGIKIVLNVDILSANRMIFRDEDDPCIDLGLVKNDEPCSRSGR
ncbi:glycine cleavage system protein T [Sesbania bispinosa]|nr:glycine cleavage system protein T [Sesbania bispinosa]